MSQILIIGAGFTSRLIAASLSPEYECTVLSNNQEHRCSSDNSLRIIHGGIRYLQAIELGRIWESLSSQKFFLNNYPDSIDIITSFLPSNSKHISRNIILFYACSKLYNFIKKCHDWINPIGKSPIANACVDSRNDILGLKWHELTFTDLLDQIYSNITNTSITSANYDTNRWLLTDKNSNVWEGKIVIDTGGYGSEALMPASLKRSPKYRMLAWNLKFTPQLIETNQGYGLDHEGKVYFAVGRKDALVVGTGYQLLSEKDLEDLPTFISTNKASFQMTFPPPFDSLNNQTPEIEYGILPCDSKGRLINNYEIGHNKGYLRVTTNKLTTTPIIAQKVVKIVKALMK